MLTPDPRCPVPQKSKNTKTGSEMQRDKESVAAMMREKQKAGKGPLPPFLRVDQLRWYGVTTI